MSVNPQILRNWEHVLSSCPHLNHKNISSSSNVLFTDRPVRPPLNTSRTWILNISECDQILCWVSVGFSSSRFVSEIDLNRRGNVKWQRKHRLYDWPLLSEPNPISYWTLPEIYKGISKTVLADLEPHFVWMNIYFESFQQSERVPIFWLETAAQQVQKFNGDCWELSHFLREIFLWV